MSLSFICIIHIISSLDIAVNGRVSRSKRFDVKYYTILTNNVKENLILPKKNLFLFTKRLSIRQENLAPKPANNITRYRNL